MLNPSYVAVPLPISSNSSSDFPVAFCRISATSVISTMNVLLPVDKSSLAPTRVKILSTGQISAFAAGTKEPMCANITIIATCRMYTLFPAILGPVIIIVRFSPSSRKVSFGTNASPFNAFSTIGCLPSEILIYFILSLITGLTKLSSVAAFARENKQSMYAICFADVISSLKNLTISATILSYMAISRALASSSALRIFDSTSFNSSEIYRSAFTVV